MSGGEIQTSLDQAKRAFDATTTAAAEELQLNLLEPISPEEMVEAREELGPDAGRITVLRHAREKRRGRPKGARNKRTDDLAKYLLQFGEDPLVGAMRLATTQPEVLIEASKQEKVHSFRRDGTPNLVIERMTYAEAVSLIMRAREFAGPYIHGKKPVAIEHSFAGVGDLVIEGLTHNRTEVQDIVEAEFMAIEDQSGDDRPPLEGGEE
jgi:hypothetical protein